MRPFLSDHTPYENTGSAELRSVCFVYNIDALYNIKCGRGIWININTKDAVSFRPSHVYWCSRLTTSKMCERYAMVSTHCLTVSAFMPMFPSIFCGTRFDATLCRLFEFYAVYISLHPRTQLQLHLCLFKQSWPCNNMQGKLVSNHRQHWPELHFCGRPFGERKADPILGSIHHFFSLQRPAFQVWIAHSTHEFFSKPATVGKCREVVRNGLLFLSFEMTTHGNYSQNINCKWII